MLASFVGIPVEHTAAVLFMCFYNEFNITNAVMVTSLPFLIGDVVKCFAAALLAVNVNKALEKSAGVQS